MSAEQQEAKDRVPPLLRRASVAAEITTKKHLITTERSGTLSVYVQGDLSQVTKRAVFLTIHDLGSNHSSFVHLIDHPLFVEIKYRSIFIHVDIPGQEDNAPDLPEDYQFPAMQTLAEDLVTVLDNLRVQLVVGFGEGAGANIMARFGLVHPNRCLGLILVHPNCGTVGVMDYVKKIFGFRGNKSSNINPTAEQYLVVHKFGVNAAEQLETAGNQERLVQDYTERLKASINPRNLRKYVKAFMERSDILGQLEKNLKLECLLVVGGRSSHVTPVNNAYHKLDKNKTSLLKVDDVCDVLQEAPDKFVQSLILFCKGIGVLTSVALPGVERSSSIGSDDLPFDQAGQRRRKMSMEDYDQPRRKSITATLQSGGQ